jgi:23S rRNA (guanosine2251-2'-O)-methyltransferase
MILILDNIRSTHNVGSIFRTADAVGVSNLYLCGVTPDPIDRFGRERSDIAKTALGAEQSVHWGHFKSTEEAITLLKEQDYTVIALEQSDNSEDYIEVAKKIDFNKTALVLGEETQGLSADLLDLVDIIAEIPMSGEKESLNVSVAAGVALFRFKH